MKFIRILCFGLLFTFAGSVQAQQFEVTPFYGYRFGGAVQNDVNGRSYDFEDAPAYGLFLDFSPKDSDMKFEVLWSHQDSSIDLQGFTGLGKLDFAIDEIQLGGVLETGRGRLREYISALAGATHYSTDGYGATTEFSLSIGGGLKFQLLRNVALRADLRGYCTVVESSSAFIYSNGVTLVSISGSSLWQGEASVGVSITF
jgi:hypothetical protein